ncbi:MAG: virulence RhuM family protein [Paludibacteraceae bacterium]|nr:virulence RhuM family protein [Paludibacteraceae bacterium]
MTDEIVLYKPNEQFQLEVQLKDDTVWLTQEQIAMLFGTQRPAITKHLNNIYNSGELTMESTCSILERMGNDGRQRYQTKYYNLDAILSVGYRVNSKNATLFRQWANRVLKEYILKGYAVNQRLIAMEDRIDRRLQEHTEQIHELQDKVDFFVRTSLPPVEQVFFEGEFFEARVLLEKIIKTATKRVIIIDAYIDATTFEMLDVRAKGVAADIYSDGLYKTLRDTHNASAGVQPINTHKWSTASHDRWLIADDRLYHCGHSVKDLGKKLSAIMLMGESPEAILNHVR